MSSTKHEFKFELPWESLLKKDLPKADPEPVVYYPPWEQPRRDYEKEQDIYDWTQIYQDDVSDPDHVNDTFVYYKNRGGSLTDFLKEFDICKLKKRKKKTLLNEYEENCVLIEKNREIFHQLKKEVENGKVLIGKEKKLYGSYLRWRFIAQRIWHYNNFYLEGHYDLRKVEY